MVILLFWTCIGISENHLIIAVLIELLSGLEMSVSSILNECQFPVITNIIIFYIKFRIAVQKKFQLCGWGETVVSVLPLIRKSSCTRCRSSFVIFVCCLGCFCTLYGLCNKTLEHTSWEILCQNGAMRTGLPVTDQHPWTIHCHFLQ